MTSSPDRAGKRSSFLTAAALFLAVSAIPLHLFFAAGTELRNFSYNLTPAANNYLQEPQKAGEADAVFLGDHVAVSLDIQNRSLRVAPAAALDISFSGPVSAVAADPADIPFHAGSARNTFSLAIPDLRPFEHRHVSLTIVPKTSGSITATAALPGAGAPQALLISVRPRPVSKTPLVPADIFSYLGDKAVALCQKVWPCKSRNADGSCASYPDSPESKKCLADRNKELFAGCDEARNDTDSWAICLMEKNGFKVSQQAQQKKQIGHYNE